MNIITTPIADLLIAETKVIGDERGSFMRLFCADELKISNPIKQINYSYTAQKGTVRGLHFQHSPMAETKIVRCLEGTIWDVAVDLRPNSPTYLKYHAIELNSQNNLAFIIPAGFAHGFQALTDNCRMLYLHTENYSPEHEGGVLYNDKKINIEWKLPAVNLSARDLSFKEIE